MVSNHNYQLIRVYPTQFDTQNSQGPRLLQDHQRFPEAGIGPGMRQ